MPTTPSASGSRQRTIANRNQRPQHSADQTPVRSKSVKKALKPPKVYEKCKYYQTERGCYNGNNCIYLHDDTRPPSKQGETCKHFQLGWCTRGDRCWYKHVIPDERIDAGSSTIHEAGPSQPRSLVEDPDEIVCGVCFETPSKFGLLTGCSHAFCLDCLRDWRKSRKKDNSLVFSNVIKTCPLCRAPSRFITPSSRFYKHDDPQKEEVVGRYKESMARVPCRYFSRSNKLTPFCPYGSDCFYSHKRRNGETYQFKNGVDQMMMEYKEDMQARRVRVRYPRSRYAAIGFNFNSALPTGPDAMGPDFRGMDPYLLLGVMRSVSSVPGLAEASGSEFATESDSDDYSSGPDPIDAFAPPRPNRDTPGLRNAREESRVADDLPDLQPSSFYSRPLSGTAVSQSMHTLGTQSSTYAAGAHPPITQAQEATWTYGDLFGFPAGHGNGVDHRFRDSELLLQSSAGAPRERRRSVQSAEASLGRERESPSRTATTASSSHHTNINGLESSSMIQDTSRILAETTLYRPSAALSTTSLRQYPEPRSRRGASRRPRAASAAAGNGRGTSIAHADDSSDGIND